MPRKKREPWTGSPEERKLDRATRLFEKLRKRLYASPKKYYYATGDEMFPWATEKAARWAEYDKAAAALTKAENEFLDRWQPEWRK